MNNETPLAQGQVDVNVRPCTCHPDDNPPRPCAGKYALDECMDEMLHSAWQGKMLDLVREYRIADDGRDVRDAWRELRQHIGVLSDSMELTVPELRAGIELQLKEIDRLRQHLRDEGDRVTELRDALHSLASVARRYLPDYDEHPEIQKADAALEPNAQAQRPAVAGTLPPVVGGPNG